MKEYIIRTDAELRIENGRLIAVHDGSGVHVDMFKELPPHGTQGNWQTGTPTEEGWYLVLWRDTIDDCEQFTALMWNNSNKTWYDVFTTDCNWVDEYHAEVIAWKKIEPYKED